MSMLGERGMVDIMKTKRVYHFLVIAALLSAIFVIYYRWQDWFPWFWPYFIFEYKYHIIGTPLLVPTLYSLVVSKWKVPALVWVVSLLGLLPLLLYYHPFTTAPIFLNVAMLVIPIAIVISLGLELEWRAKQKNTALERERERQMYMTQIFRAQEDERSRIAQELHDDAIQTLMVIASNASSLVSTEEIKAIPAVGENLEWTRGTALRLAEDMRRLTLDLRPSVLDTMGLIPALNWLVNSFASDHSIRGRLEVDGEICALKPEADVAIFRIAQEALSNVSKHSKATTFCVRVEYLPKLLELSIQDNGVGFTLPESMGSYSREAKIGLLGMQQRARLLGGTFNVDTEIGKGTLILTQIPV